MMHDQARDERSRNWTMIVYPDSAPENWRQILHDEYARWAVSPLHDADENADGEQKKSHWHIALMYGGKKSYTQISNLARKINAPMPQKLADARGIIRYMLHLDNPEKKQYQRHDIEAYGGIDIDEYLKPTKTQRYQTVREITDWIDDNDCVHYADLFKYAKENKDEWYMTLIDTDRENIKSYILSRWQIRREVLEVKKRLGEKYG